MPQRRAWRQTLVGGIAIVLGVTNGQAAIEQAGIPLVRGADQIPVVDGVMRGNEWQYALALTGLVSNDGPLSQRQATVYYLTDGEWLYVGMHAAAVPEGTAPEVKDNQKYDSGSYMVFAGNDRIEAKFSPPNHLEAGDLYIVADAAGHNLVLNIKGEETRLRPAWDYKTSYDGKGWTAEMRIPLKVCGVDHVSDGDRWRVNFTLARLFPLKYDGLAAGGPHALSDAVFRAGAPAVQVERLGDLPGGKLDLAVSVREYEGLVATPKETAYEERRLESGGLKLAATGKTARVSWSLLDAKGTAVDSAAQLLTLQPGRKQTATVARSFTPGPRNTLKLTVELADDANAFAPDADPAKLITLYAASLPFVPFNRDEERQWQERLTRGTVPGSWRFNPAFFPYWEKAKVQAVFFKGQIRDQAATLRVTVTSDRGFRAQREVPIVNGTMKADTPDGFLDIPIPGLPEGTYTARGEILDNNGKLVASQERTYVRKVYPWEHNTIGKSRGAIQPWTPMSAAGSTIACWGRQVELTPTGLPARIVSQETSLLETPVTLELLGADGQALPLVANGPLTITETAADCVRWAGHAHVGDNLTMTVTGLAEYDGFTWYEMTLAPKQPVALGSGRILISLPEREAQLMHFQSSWARSNFSGAVPALPAAANGTGVVFRSLDTKNYGRTGGFSPHVWLGNLTRGLSWFADSDEGWSSAADRSALEVLRSGGQVQLALNIVAKPLTLDKPRIIRFGLMATPFKPLLPIREMPRRAVNWLSATDSKTVVQAHMYGLYPPNFDYSLIDKHLPGWRLYFNKHEMGAALPERAVFDNEWGGMEPAPDYPGAPERFGPGIESRAINRALTDSRIDMLVYYIAELAKKTKMGGTYWDITGIGSGLPLIENGTAYVSPETGNLVPTFDILKSRQLFRRVATLWQEIRGEPDHMEIHSTNHMGIPFYSFGYLWLNFEWLWPSAKATRPDGRWQDFIDLRPLDLFATEGVPSQFGVWIQSINGGARPEDPSELRRILRSALALGSLHNHFTGHTPTIGPRDQLKFVGYWDENRRATADHDLVRASYWHQGNRLELVVANLDADARPATVTLPLAPLGWKAVGPVREITGEAELEQVRDSLKRRGKPEQAQAVDAVIAATRAARTAPEIRTAGGTLEIRLDLPSHDCRMFTFEAQP